MNSKVTKRGEMNEVALFAQETLIIIDFIIGEYIIYMHRFAIFFIQIRSDRLLHFHPFSLFFSSTP